MKKFILSPCGTSILTNQASPQEKKLVFKYANEKKKDDITQEEDRDKLELLIKRSQSSIATADHKKASELSAELNGIIKIYGGQIPSNNDFHFLLSTDTWLGNETAKIVEEWLKLKNNNFAIDVYRQIDLQTNDITAFQLSLSDLIKKLAKEIPEYSNAGYKIMFNLTGGFKSIQGFLQSIANFYADETIYIFETATELMRIPRLPVRMDAIETIENNLIAFRKMNAGFSVSYKEINDIPETLLLKIGSDFSLSPWGGLLFSESKTIIYGKKLFPSPDSKIVYSDRFQSHVETLQAGRIILINERIDQLMQYLNDSKYNPPSLDFKKLKGKPLKKSTHEMDAWPDLDAKRIFGHFENEIFVLDKLDKGLH
ncbi:CRISPR-associated protein domain-containing protein [Desulfonema limicola]|uniref:CRISPR-associated protein domain-containing protein n=1 Tax=Desulfonema limicola TaxID=45656 RepID=A0A975B7E7_9BACT|nr:putative CRISPR-associated protein [Desulfonema limicola]QTA80245.1 CRISPR-associated protein domain-containing protein [Desulfonema limicola]